MEVIALVILLAIVVPIGLLILLFFVSSRTLRVRDDRTPFECGFDPKRMARVPFSLRFFLLAVIFLIFDVEVALLFPLCYSIYLSNKFLVFILRFLFIFIVGIGLFLEWGGGALD